jgi:hypothetical protein
MKLEKVLSQHLMDKLIKEFVSKRYLKTNYFIFILSFIFPSEHTIHKHLMQIVPEGEKNLFKKKKT